jgi:enoyl-CoA hydratase/carnithine racemase
VNDGRDATSDVVLYDSVDSVATIRFNRPDRMNAWTYEMEDIYFDLLTRADDDPSVRVIVVTGSGRGFCAGLDAAVLAERAVSGAGPRERVRPMSLPLTVRKPMIAAINGGCAGIGFYHALCCDVRFAAKEAKLATSFTRRGIAPEFGITWLLTRIVGVGHASDLLLSGRAVTGEEGAMIGLVNRALPLDDLLPAVYEYARDVAVHCAPRAVAHAKQQLWADATRSFEDSYAHGVALQHGPDHAADMPEGAAAFVERRAPAFEPLPPREPPE